MDFLTFIYWIIAFLLIIYYVFFEKKLKYFDDAFDYEQKGKFDQARKFYQLAHELGNTNATNNLG